jgi:hypothetical protein
MEFIIFMIVFAFVLTFILWQVIKPRKPSKKPKRQTKKIPPAKKITPEKPKPVLSNSDVRRIIATELFKRNPEVVTQVVKQMLRKK